MKPLIVAHRGASADAPENTLAAFRLAWAHGADAIEGDFRLTADGHWVCIHDATFLRTAGDDRRVDAMTLDEIHGFDVGRWKGEPFAGEHVPTLNEVLAIVPVGKRLFLEMKTDARDIEPMLAQLSEAREQVRVISFDAEVVAAAKRVRGVVAHWLIGFDPQRPSDWLGVDAVLSQLDQIGADGVDLQANPDAVDAAFVGAIHASGREVHTWTIDEPELARHFALLGVDSITTNRPEPIRTALS